MVVKVVAPYDDTQFAQIENDLKEWWMVVVMDKPHGRQTLCEIQLLLRMVIVLHSNISHPLVAVLKTIFTKIGGLIKAP